MLSSLVSFLGGSVFRMLWGEISAMLTARQDHRHEIERLRLQGDLDAAAHKRNLEALRVQSDLGVKVIEVQRDADLSRVEADAWLDSVRAVGRQTGIKWLDAWNGAIRPSGATMALLMIASEIVVAGWAISPENRDVLFAFLGLFVADRSLAKRGK